MVDVGGSSPHIYMRVLTKHIMEHSLGTIVNLAIATLFVICHSERPLARAKWLVFARKGALRVFSEVMLLEVVCVVFAQHLGAFYTVNV